MHWRASLQVAWSLRHASLVQQFPIPCPLPVLLELLRLAIWKTLALFMLDVCSSTVLLVASPIRHANTSITRPKLVREELPAVHRWTLQRPPRTAARYASFPCLCVQGSSHPPAVLLPSLLSLALSHLNATPTTDRSLTQHLRSCGCSHSVAVLTATCAHIYQQALDPPIRQSTFAAIACFSLGLLLQTTWQPFHSGPQMRDSQSSIHNQHPDWLLLASPATLMVEVLRSFFGTIN